MFGNLPLRCIIHTNAPSKGRVPRFLSHVCSAPGLGNFPHGFCRGRLSTRHGFHFLRRNQWWIKLRDAGTGVLLRESLQINDQALSAYVRYISSDNAAPYLANKISMLRRFVGTVRLERVGGAVRQ